MKYDFQRIEQKWRSRWLEERTYEPDLAHAKKPFYNLMMFPYPSAEGLHVGNMYAFTGADIYGRMKRMQGFDVFEPIGLDGFGIHSENYALKIGAHPGIQAKKSQENFYRQLGTIGNGFAWEERLETYDPAYYRWTQWIFVQLWKHGLAYRKQQPVNWCPSCKTVLADEQVVAGACERCKSAVERRDLEQWFFRITKYAERLLNNLEKIDWSERVKIAQRNWIGKSEGADITFKLIDIPGQPDGVHELHIFTTRPDTLFGATFMVISPELAQTWLGVGWKAGDEVRKYVRDALARRGAAESEIEKEKTGVFSGVYAVNPATQTKIPVWVSDYILAGYGTGAIMAVPAHDARDFEFAKRYKLPIRQVVAPYFLTTEGKDAVRADKPTIKRKTVYALLKHGSEDRYLCLDWEKFGWHSGIIGGVDEGEDITEAAAREIREETGYANPKFKGFVGGETHSNYFAGHKDENRYSIGYGLLFELKDDTRNTVEAEHTKNHTSLWIEGSKMKEWLNLPVFQHMWRTIEIGNGCFTGDGIAINSGKFDGMTSAEAIPAITVFAGGKLKTQYRLRDWLISRQRYWGPPIPMIHCAGCETVGKGEQKEMPGWYAIPEENLPVLLPHVKDFQPKGKGASPLASVKEFYETTCPGCGGAARRETDVSDTFLDSAWYYIGYLAHINNKQETKNNPFSNPLVKKWLPVDLYTGGAEHSVLHLLYVRFLSLALHDMGLLEFSDASVGTPDYEERR
ncbi:MAG: class I tRNA ligase family protein, partial [Patescibacteria group bacterium]